ncbi:uncharacterized protein PV07_05599 [Cladophialophora immunda]|uniref:Xylanolytic transcriptional activator regulatory domain-containing protein n=1 Tax=Cladophialophora immunda TaxID=569365 RepID=A0A0D2AWZ7_9EURO|nr:uncharacterized protein PV07_05599 [Cladophialophora immunda]KIW29812.1 hypothetical protein PV07_05599 [Cladophialophora immunda]OQV08709.1 Fungal specific transcription factor domain-containing protein [Cladophialophora immunda]
MMNASRPHKRKRHDLTRLHGLRNIPAAVKAPSSASLIRPVEHPTLPPMSEAATERSTVTTAKHGNSCSPASENLAYVGRPEYLPGEFATEREPDADPPKTSRGDAEITYLQSLKAFDFPPRPVRDGLIDNFLKICSPWMPVVEIEDLKLQSAGSGHPDSTQGGSLLLTQAVLVAGSRVQPTALLPNSDCATFYNKAKALFFADLEPDPLHTISALCLMQWYNPSGPEHVSIHSSGFWLRIAVGLGFQIGLHREPDPRSAKCKLRRRLFWTLFARDCLLSIAQGRPRAINLVECNISLPTVADFPQDNKNARLFVAYVEICSILGQCGKALSGGYSHWAPVEVGRSLQRWISHLPECLKLNNALDYDFEVRQLYLIYFTAISILYGPGRSGNCTSVAPILASSCVARIFEDFLARDQLRCLAPMTIFYLRVAALPQLCCFNFGSLWDISKLELSVIQRSLHEMAKTWHSARRALRILTSLVNAVRRGQEAHRPLTDLDLSPEQLSFFEMVPAELCPKRHIIEAAVDATGVSSQEKPDARFQSTSALANPSLVTLRRDPTAVCDSTTREPTMVAPLRSLSTALDASSGEMQEYTAADSWFTRDSDDWTGIDEALGPGLGLDDDDFFMSLHERLLQDLR